MQLRRLQSTVILAMLVVGIWLVPFQTYTAQASAGDIVTYGTYCIGAPNSQSNIWIDWSALPGYLSSNGMPPANHWEITKAVNWESVLIWPVDVNELGYTDYGQLTSVVEGAYTWYNVHADTRGDEASGGTGGFYAADCNATINVVVEGDVPPNPSWVITPGHPSSYTGSGNSSINARPNSALYGGTSYTIQPNSVAGYSYEVYNSVTGYPARSSFTSSFQLSPENSGQTFYIRYVQIGSDRPDLTAGQVTPTTATVGTVVTLQSTITNVGNVGTGNGFSNIFQISSNSSGSGATVHLFSSPALASNGGTFTGSISHNFSTAGTYYIRACADADSRGPSDTGATGTIAESNESNNCGPWREVVVSSGTTSPDMCLNIAGTQETVPDGMYRDSYGNCYDQVYCPDNSPAPYNDPSACEDNNFYFYLTNGGNKTVTRPNTITQNITVTYQQGPTQSVALSASGFPNDSDGSFSPTSCTPNSTCTSTLTINVGPSAPLGNHNINVTGTSAGVQADTSFVLTISSALPDLTAAAPTQTTATVNTQLNFTSVISNIGNASTGASFSNFFQVATAADGGGTITGLSATTMSTLAAGATGTATSPSYTFTSAGTYSVRACADKSSSTNNGTITESNENNNCGAWTTVTVSSPLAVPVVSISASPTSGTVNVVNPSITWSATNSPSSCTATGDWSGSKGVSGTESQGVLTTARTYTYTLTCSNTTGTSAPVSATVVVSSAPGSCVAAGSGTGLTGKYYDGMNFNTLVTTRTDGTINFNPADSLGVNYANSPDGDTFSVRWEGQVEPRCSESYTFFTNTDDGVRLWVNGVLVIDRWVDQGPTEIASSAIALTGGTRYNIRMDFYENGGGAVAQLSWSSPTTAKQIIPQSQLYPLALPDLTAAAPTQTTATVNTQLNFTSVISNIGNASTGASFSNFFQVATAADGGGTITGLSATTMSTLAAGATGTATSPSYTFTSAGTYSVRACADKSSSTNNGTITESNENNNCGAWTPVTVSSALAVPVVSISASPTGGTVNVVNPSITWSATNSPGSCTATGDWSGSKTASTASSTESQGVLTTVKTYTYTLTCSNTTGTSAPVSATVVVSEVARPDLTAGTVTPTTATVGTAVTLQSTITNNSTTAGTGDGFTNIFQIADSSSGSGATVLGTFSRPTALASNSNFIGSLSYTFPSGDAGTTKYIRACADADSRGPSDTGATGTITESNEGNNCSSTWTAVVVSAAASPAVLNVSSTGVSGVSITRRSGTNGTAGTTNYTYTNASSISTVLRAPSTASGSSFISWTGCNSVSGTGGQDCSVSVAQQETKNIVANYNAPAQPNLRADAPTQTTATVNTALNFTSVIRNIGNASTGASFSNFFQVATAADGGGTITGLSATTMSTLAAGATGTATSPSYTFTSAGTYSVRACADKSSATNNGTITESNEEDNCSGWTNVTVGGGVQFDYSLSSPGSLTITKSASGNASDSKSVTKTLLTGNTESVNITATNVPTGVSVSYGNRECSPTCTSTVNFDVSQSAAAGTYPITVTGTPLSKTVQFNLIIENASGSGGGGSGSLAVTCTASPSSPFVGQEVTWTASVSGGSGNYSFTWSGTDIPTSPAPTGNPYRITYTRSGTKVAIATVTDGTASGSCPTEEPNVTTVQVRPNPFFEEF